MLEKRANTTFIKLPVNLQKEITGGCQCSYCKAHPTKTPVWDTLATDGKTSWTVHYPELGKV
jgi:hypothetical protein